jgi:hypothetical protein
MTDYACPNGHVFPGALTVPCDECGAAVVCEPIAAGIRLHEALEAADAMLAEVRLYAVKMTRDREDLVRRLGADLLQVIAGE